MVRGLLERAHRARSVLSAGINRRRSARRIGRTATIEDGHGCFEAEEVYSDLVQQGTRVAPGQITGVEQKASPVPRVERSDERRASPSPEPQARRSRSSRRARTRKA